MHDRNKVNVIQILFVLSIRNTLSISLNANHFLTYHKLTWRKIPTHQILDKEMRLRGGYERKLNIMGGFTYEQASAQVHVSIESCFK